MRFGPVPLAEARGAILAHSQRLGERMLRKGSVLDEAAIAALRDAGRAEVIAARLEPGDVPEDIAADRMAAPLISPLLARSRAATGRVNLAAETSGLLRVDADKIDRLNGIDEALTVGTLADCSVVAARDLVATIKVIPLAVPGMLVSVAETLARQGKPALTLHPFKPLKVGLVVTELPGLKESTTEKTIAVTEARVRALTGTLLPPRRAPHEEAAVAAALEALLGEGWGKRNNPEAEGNISRLLDSWRSSRMPVVFFQHMSRNPKSPLFPGQTGNEIKDIVRPIGEEKVFAKNVNSCFIGTGFEDWLRESGIDSLVIVGITTQHCVSTTARMAGNLGFRTFVISDATAAFETKGINGEKYDAETVHALSLATIMGEFATVLSTNDILKMI